MLKKILFKIILLIDKKTYAKLLGVNCKNDIRIMRGISFGSEPYLIEIGEKVTISNDVQFITHDGSTCLFRNQERYKDVVKYGKIKISNNCFIGARTIIMPGCKIGNNCIVAAGSVVTKSIPDNTVVGGNPAKKICSYEEYLTKIEKNNIKYNVINYRKDKKQEVIKICDKIGFKGNIKI